MQLELFEVEKKIVTFEEGERVRQCNGCKETFPETEEYFHIAYTSNPKNSAPVVYYSSKCRPCHNEQKLTIHYLQKEHGHKAYGNCECCGVAAKDTRMGKLVLDHDHETGEYRGHICDPCNRGIGMLGDTLIGVSMALEYLRKVKSEKD
jgi:hypothetical protein